MADESANRLDIVKRLGAVGNSIVWEIAYDILNLIASIEAKEGREKSFNKKNDYCRPTILQSNK